MPFPKCLLYDKYVLEMQENEKQAEIICEKVFYRIFPFNCTKPKECDLAGCICIVCTNWYEIRASMTRHGLPAEKSLKKMLKKFIELNNSGMIRVNELNFFQYVTKKDGSREATMRVPFKNQSINDDALTTLIKQVDKKFKPHKERLDAFNLNIKTLMSRYDRVVESFFAFILFLINFDHFLTIFNQNHYFWTKMLK